MTDRDDGSVRVAAGSELRDEGIEVGIEQQPGSRLLRYRRI